MSEESGQPNPGVGASIRATNDEPRTSEGTVTAPDRPPTGVVLRGATVCPGLVLGRVHRKDHDLTSAGVDRVALDEVDHELNRFRKSLDESRSQLQDLKARLEGRVARDDARILDTHLTYLRDSVFIADVENLILNEQMRLEGAIAKVVGDFDRIFRLVRNDTLRQSAIDLRDVGIRVLRNLERDATDVVPAAPVETGDYVLVAKELSIVDMFNLANEHVKGIVTRDGALTSHAAIFARSMRIPTITGVEELLEQVHEGDFVILDAAEGCLRVEPEEAVRAQYAETVVEREQTDAVSSAVTPAWATVDRSTKDGEEVSVLASCGNLPEVERASELGMGGVGLYRTELFYLVDQTPPSRDALTHHYAAVVGAARGAPVTFRLLNVDASVGIPYLHPDRERNPGLGRVGVRALLANEPILRRQLQALLLAGQDAEIRIAVPFVVDCGELRRVREILLEERFELQKRGDTIPDTVPLGVVVETPAALLGIRSLAQDADFLLLNLDSLQQYLLATDRENPELAHAFDTLHPVVLRALTKACQVAVAEDSPLLAFGVSSWQPGNLPFLIGAGLRHFCVPPAELRAFLTALTDIDASTAKQATQAVAQSSCPEETRSLVAGYRHGYPRR